MVRIFLFYAMAKIIAIGGVSRSGKSTLAQWLHQQLPGSVMLCQDDFPNDEDSIPMVRDRTDWEHPDSIHWGNWKRAIDNFQDCEYLILEGLFIFRPEAALTPHLAIYLETDQDSFTRARKQETRWGHEPDWYIDYVWQNHFKYGLPSGDLKALKYHQLSEKNYPEILSKVKA